MSNTAEELARDVARDLGKKRTTIHSTATFLVFEPGLYAVSFTASSSGSSDVGLRLPCARLESVPSPGGGQAFVSMVPDTGWLSTETGSAHVLVVGGRAGALLTIYRSSDAVDMPRVEFRVVIKAKDTPDGFVAAPARTAEAPVADASLAFAKLALTVHLQELGDKSVSNGEWCAGGNARDLIEGFQMAVSKDGETVDVEYQGFMGKDWLTQWFKTGQYCGSRGLQLPMLGFRLRLPDAVARKYSLQYWGVFGGTDVVGPIVDGSLCESNQKPLTSMKILVGPALASAKAAPAKAAPAKATKKPAARPKPKPKAAKAGSTKPAAKPAATPSSKAFPRPKPR